VIINFDINNSFLIRFIRKMRCVLLTILPSIVFGVTVLTNETFDGHVGGETGVFVKMFAPWCGHCKAMADDWIKLSEKYAENPVVDIAEMDCTEYGSTCQKYGVQGFPTLMAFPVQSSEPEQYTGAREFDKFVEFVDGGALNAVCTSLTKDVCDADGLKEIEELEALGTAVIAERIAAQEQAIQDAEAAMKATTAELQATFAAAQEAMKTAIEAASAPLKQLKRITIDDSCDCCDKCST
jgi:protein disulfide-isomerase A6